MKFVDRAVWLEKEKILVISDLHIGFEEYLNKQGIFVPRSQYEKTIEDFEKIFKKIGKIKEIVILGDLKHEFGTVSNQEWKDVLGLLDFFQERCKKITLIKGNHDTILEPIAKRKEIKVKEFYIKKGFGFLHGHKWYKGLEKVKVLLLGHMHPAVSICEGAKSEIYKCFLNGKWKGKKIIILPSFFPFVEGSDVNMKDTNLASEFDFKLKNFKIYVPVSVSEVLSFGKLGVMGKLV